VLIIPPLWFLGYHFKIHSKKTFKVWPGLSLSLSEAFLRVARSMEPLWFQHPQHPIFPHKNKELHKMILGETLEHVMSMQSSLWKHFLHFRGSTFQNLTSPAPLGIPNRSGHACHTATLWSTTLRFLSERLNCNDGSTIRVASHCWILLQIHLYIYIYTWCICNVVFLGWLCHRGRLQPTESTLPWKLFLLALPWNKIGAKKSESGWEWVTGTKIKRWYLNLKIWES